MIILSFGCLSFGRRMVLDQIHCNSLHDHESFDATNYPLAASAVAECVASLQFIARRADSLHGGCVCNAMQRNAKLPARPPPALVLSDQMIILSFGGRATGRRCVHFTGRILPAIS